jgi:hypothetical protein
MRRFVCVVFRNFVFDHSVLTHRQRLSRGRLIPRRLKIRVYFEGDGYFFKVLWVCGCLKNLLTPLRGVVKFLHEFMTNPSIDPSKLVYHFLIYRYSFSEESSNISLTHISFWKAYPPTLVTP